LFAKIIIFLYTNERRASRIRVVADFVSLSYQNEKWLRRSIFTTFPAFALHKQEQTSV